jgi:cellobiose phosphorylase
MDPSTLDPINDVPLHPRPGIVDPPARYGHFDAVTGEYVITRPDTPQPWYNYITNGSFTGFVSHTGGGTCYGRNDSVEKRILRTHLHSRPADQPGRWIYIRDRDTGGFHSATWAPVYTPLSRFTYRCRVGPGSSTIAAECSRIRSEVTYFVGPDAEAELWLLTVTNLDRRTRRLDVFPYAEFFLWSLARDSNLDAAFKCTDIAVDGRVIVHRSYYDWGVDRGGWKRQYAYFACSAAPASFDTNLEAFVGVYRGYDRPLAVAAGRCSNFNNRGGEPVAAMQIPVTLRGGASRTLAFAVGYAASDADAGRQGRRVAAVAFAREQLAKVRRHWRGYLDRFQADTPDATFHVPFNTLTPYQSAITFICSRSISPYQLTGGRGLGYRDSNQDSLGAMPYQPAAASRKLIATLLSVQNTRTTTCGRPCRSSGMSRSRATWPSWTGRSASTIPTPPHPSSTTWNGPCASPKGTSAPTACRCCGPPTGTTASTPSRGPRASSPPPCTAPPPRRSSRCTPPGATRPVPAAAPGDTPPWLSGSTNPPGTVSGTAG